MTMTKDDDNITDNAEYLAAAEVKRAKEALAKAEASLAAARAKVARRAKVCADLRASVKLARAAMIAMLEARDDAAGLIPEEDMRTAPGRLDFWTDDDRSALWGDLLIAAENIEDAEEAAIALAEHIEKNGENI